MRDSTSVRLMRFSSILTIESARPFRMNEPSEKISAKSAVANPSGFFMYGLTILRHPSSPIQILALSKGVNLRPFSDCCRYAIPLVSVEPYTSSGQKPKTFSVFFASSSEQAPPLEKIHGFFKESLSSISTVRLRKAGVAIIMYFSSVRVSNSSGTVIRFRRKGTPSVNGSEMPNKNP